MTLLTIIIFFIENDCMHRSWEHNAFSSRCLAVLLISWNSEQSVTTFDPKIAASTQCPLAMIALNDVACERINVFASSSDHITSHCETKSLKVTVLPSPQLGTPYSGEQAAESMWGALIALSRFSGFGLTLDLLWLPGLSCVCVCRKQKLKWALSSLSLSRLPRESRVIEALGASWTEGWKAKQRGPTKRDFCVVVVCGGGLTIYCPILNDHRDCCARLYKDDVCKSVVLAGIRKNTWLEDHKTKFPVCRFDSLFKVWRKRTNKQAQMNSIRFYCSVNFWCFTVQSTLTLSHPQLVALYGVDARIYLLSCLLEEVDFREVKTANQIKELPKVKTIFCCCVDWCITSFFSFSSQLAILVQEVAHAQTSPNFAASLCQALEGSIGRDGRAGRTNKVLEDSFFPNLARACRLTLQQQVDLALSSVASEVPTVGAAGVRFMKIKCPEVIDMVSKSSSGDQAVTPETLVRLIDTLSTHPELSVGAEEWLSALRRNFTANSCGLTMLPVLMSGDAALAMNMAPQLEELSGAGEENVALFVRDLGYAASTSTQGQCPTLQSNAFVYQKQCSR
jgi:hypothetical protein